MASPSDKLAESLALLKELQDRGLGALRTSDLSRTHRERLLRNGFVREVMKGWLIPTRPDEPAGESTSWFASFWTFCTTYLNARFGDAWCLGAEQSIRLHTGDWRIPAQLLVRSPRGGNKPTELLFGTSIFDLRLKLPARQDMELKHGLRVFKLPAALVNCPSANFRARPVEMRAALAMVTDASELLRHLLEGGHSSIAGRLAGAFRNIGRSQTADDIVHALRAAGHAVHEVDPFEDDPLVSLSARETSPHINRLRMNWAQMRLDVLQLFPLAPGLPSDSARYLKEVDAVYVSDAYNSLSIEGYKVSAELIEHVRSGQWDPDNNRRDQAQRDALAARGYWQAFRRVKESIGAILRAENPGPIVEADHAAWYRELFAPGVAAGLIRPGDLAGYRNGPVHIRYSMHTPPGSDEVPGLMSAFLDLLKAEKEPAVRVVLGHFVFVYIHPYFDGNGRMGRFLMNVMLAAGGYPWTIVPLEQRTPYMEALEKASVDGDIKPFTRFLAALVAKSISG